jgi:hypothetical protein
VSNVDSNSQKLFEILRVHAMSITVHFGISMKSNFIKKFVNFSTHNLYNQTIEKTLFLVQLVKKIKFQSIGKPIFC